MKQQVLRSFTEPTDIVVLGSGFSWKIGLKEAEGHDEFLKSISKFERGITDDYSGIDIDEKWMETHGLVTVLTTEELKYLEDNGFLEEYFEGMSYNGFIGEILIGVLNDETKEYMQLSHETKDYYILYDLKMKTILIGIEL